MPRQQVKKTYFTFIGGLNTEAGYLTFPPNVWKEGDNVIPQVEGSIEARTSVNYEHDFVISSNEQTDSEKQSGAYSIHSWSNVAGNSSSGYAVVQRGAKLYVYEDRASAMSATEKGITYVVNLTSYLAPNFALSAALEPIQAVSINGKLIVTSSVIKPLLLEDTGTALTVTPIAIKFRDFKGVDDGLIDESVDTEPTTLSDNHKYNLLNQGWTATTISAYFAAIARYPSNAQQWFLGKDTLDNFDPTLLTKQVFGKSRSPKGKMILDAFLQDRSAASGVGSVTTTVVAGRPSACAFFAGRAWYAGVPGALVNSWVFFSQVVLGNSNLGQCYQEADPSSEHISDLIASDGGVVVIPGVGSILKLVPMGNAMVVFADNGVWAIRGTDTGGFSAINYDVTQVTKVGAISASPIVSTEAAILFWTESGIWGIGPDPNSGFLTATNTSQQAIASFYASIDATAKLYASGKYFTEDKKVYWLFQETPNVDGVTDRFKKDRMLVLDTRLGAYYTHTIGALASNSPEVVDLYITANKGVLSGSLNVIDEAETLVVDENEAQVYVNLLAGVGSTTALKFLTVTPSSAWSATFSEFEDGTVQAAKWYDWYSKDNTGIGYVPFILTGYDLGAGQGGDRKLQTNYITILMKRTETGIDTNGDPINASSITVNARWHFTDSSVANKWSTETQVYRHRRVFIPVSLPSSTFVDGFPVVIAKHKLRGRGNAFQLKFHGEAGKDFQLIGWSIPVLNNME